VTRQSSAKLEGWLDKPADPTDGVAGSLATPST
jgi:hypothetical protein